MPDLNASESTDKETDKSAYLPYLDTKILEELEKEGLVLVGKLRIGVKNPFNAYITCDNEVTDYMVSGVRDRNRALDGDVVWALLKTANVKRAVVVGIKEQRGSRIVVGTIEYQKNNYAQLLPQDSRLPKLRIPIEFCKGLNRNGKKSLFATEITSWEKPNYAMGSQLFKLGEPGTIEAETDAILLRFGLDVSPYPQEYCNGLPDESYELTDQDISGREDWRKECVFTIDPLTARDLDDAVSWKALPSGGAIVGVHIADVSYFLPTSTVLDDAVAARATTIYLVDRVFHMLPPQLCKACSLTPGRDKLSFSVIFELSPDGEILSRRFAKTVINSCIQLSYEQAQDVLDKKDIVLNDIKNGISTADVMTTILELGKLTEKMKDSRVKNGALRIDQTKVYFRFDHFLNVPLQVLPQSRLPAHSMIEELMLLANTTVAQFLQESIPEYAFLRYHPPPKDEYFNRIKAQLKQLDVELDSASSGALQASLTKLEGNSEIGVGKLQVIHHMLAKTMTRAKYACNKNMCTEETQGHYALSIPVYTHFTSPIRRYADIIVHRLLQAVLTSQDSPMSSDDIQEAASVCNNKKFSAKSAEEGSCDLFYAFFIGEQGSLFVEATISSLYFNTFEAVILDTKTHVIVYFEDVDGKVESIREENSNSPTSVKIEWNDGKTQILEMFSTVHLELTRGRGVTIDARLLPI